MESPQPATGSSQKRESARGDARPETAAAALRMRLWAYGGERGKLRDLLWAEDKPVGELVRQVISGSHGNVAEEYASFVVARFGDPLHALAAAKSLQQRLLSLHREPLAGQVVAAIVVDERCAHDSKAAKPAAESGPARLELLGDVNCAQILVSEKIYDVARTIPGFDFNSNPLRESTESGGLETLYELRWTDESTYGHLRNTSPSPEPIPSPQRRYTIQSELGRGCMGVVYKAYDEVIGRPVALKTITVNRGFPNRNELIERLKQEAKAAGSLDHPNIITIYDVGQEEDLLYLSMQLVEGKTLMALITEGNLPSLIDLLSYAEQMCNAVGFAHQRGVIHRDLKPANFMVTGQGIIKVLDFGIAKIEDATLTQTGMIVGTPTYMAPEQARAKRVDQRSDIFSLGSVFYELFTREKPFKGDITTVLYKLIHEDPSPPSVINPALPIGIDAIIRKALAKDPAERFQTCEGMRDAFRQQAVLLQQASSSKPGDAVTEKPPSVTVEDLLAEVKPRRFHRGIWVGLVAALLVAAGVVTWAFRAQVKTGSLPPALVKVFAMLKPGKIHPSSAGSGSGAQEPSSRPSSSLSDPGQLTDVNFGQAAKTDQANPAPAAASLQPPSTANATDSTGQPAPVSQDAIPAQSPSGSAPSSGDSEKAQPKDVNPFEPRNHSQKVSVPDAGDNSVKVEGFSRRDLPDLLRRAEDAAGRGDYRLARYEYDIILRLDHQNAAARAGLRRVVEAEQER